jgi:hypothetical protein
VDESGDFQQKIVETEETENLRFQRSILTLVNTSNPISEQKASNMLRKKIILKD